MKKLVVLGGGISGYGSAILARRKGFDVFLSDSGRIADRYRMKLEAWGVPYEEGGHSEERILAASECVKSPGIPDSAPIVRKLRERGVPVISEIEFAGRYLDGARTICITGSNGKTTTTSLVYRILRDAGCNVALGGNIGESFAYSVATGRYDWYVLELSSFQLDGMFRFRADIGVLTNITPDHLDRYDHSFAEVCRSEDAHCAEPDVQRDYFIYSADDETIWSLLPSYRLPHAAAALRRTGCRRRAATGDAFLSRDGRFTAAVGDRSVEIDTRRDAVSAGCTTPTTPWLPHWPTLAAGVAPDAYPPFDLRFRAGRAPSRTRARKRTACCGSTTRRPPTSIRCAYALESMKRPVVWIAGGTDKGNDYEPLKAFAREKVHTLVCMGVDNRQTASGSPSRASCRR